MKAEHPTLNRTALELIMRDVLEGMEEFTLRGSVYCQFEIVDPDGAPQWDAKRSQGRPVVLQFRHK
jgi:hypothetical protein